MDEPVPRAAAWAHRHATLVSLLVGLLVFSPFAAAAVAQEVSANRALAEQTQEEAARVAAQWTRIARDAARDLALLQAAWSNRERLGDFELRNFTATLAGSSPALERVHLVDAKGDPLWSEPPAPAAASTIASNRTLEPWLALAAQDGPPVVSPPTVRDGVLRFLVATPLDATDGTFAVGEVEPQTALDVAETPSFALRFLNPDAPPHTLGEAADGAPRVEVPLLETSAALRSPPSGSGRVEVAATQARAGLPVATAATAGVGLLVAAGAGFATRRTLRLARGRADARAELARSEAHYRTLFEEAGEMIFVLGRDGRFRDANPKTTLVLGRSRHELRDLRVEETVHPGDARDFLAAIEGTRGDGAHAIEVRFRSRDGSFVETYGTLTPHGAEEGSVIVQAHLADVTRLRALQRELSTANAALHDKVNELDAFAHTVAHDLKTPLRAVLSYAEFVDEDARGVLPEESRAQLSEIRRSATRMKDLVDAMLLYARSGSEQYPVEQVEVRALVEEAVEDLTPLIQERRAHVSMLPGFPTLAAHRVPLKQVFYNLVANAIRHNPGDSPEVVISAHPAEGEAWEFQVHDNGPGVPEDAKERIFELFSRAGASEVSGTGVGLSIVKRVVQQHLGEVWVENETEGGATFHFTIGRLAPDEGAKAAKGA